jgi:hypothetical protein
MKQDADARKGFGSARMFRFGQYEKNVIGFGSRSPRIDGDNRNAADGAEHV